MSNTELSEDEAKKRVERLMSVEKETPASLCPGCQRPELHKMCPAWGTSYYMSGIPFTVEIEEATKGERSKAREEHRKWLEEQWAKGIDTSGLS